MYHTKCENKIQIIEHIEYNFILLFIMIQGLKTSKSGRNMLPG